MRRLTTRWIAPLVFLLLGGLLTVPGHAAPDDKKEKGAEKKQTKKSKEPKSVFDFKVKDITGKNVDLSKFRDQVLMVVNVASQ